MSLGKPSRFLDDPAKWSDDDLALAAAQMKDLTAHPAWRVFEELLEAEHERNVVFTTTVARPHADYLRTAGIVRGLELAYSAPAKVLNAAQERSVRREREARNVEESRG